ncbi:helix-turn-helix domain-containing protein [Amaricoccus tamworthensis]|uniref:helix-turn-helix domain-containing protein n=1 Tax=Amaricoccus tamworthensis TaxID=57002 RepID=UPI003C7D4C9D
MSRRNFTRHFRANVGLTFVKWRTRACVLAAISRLVAGEQERRIAFDLGYDSAASFAAMFRRATGVQPSRYRRDYVVDS